MVWTRLLLLGVLCAAFPWIACLVVPGAGWKSMARMMAFVWVLPWMIVPASLPVRVIFRALKDGFRDRAEAPEVSARVFHVLGGLTCGAGLLALFGTFLTFVARISDMKGDAPPASILPGVAAAMMAPVVLALLTRLLFYDGVAAALRSGVDLQGGLDQE